MYVRVRDYRKFSVRRKEGFEDKVSIAADRTAPSLFAHLVQRDAPRMHCISIRMRRSKRSEDSKRDGGRRRGRLIAHSSKSARANRPILGTNTIPETEGAETVVAWLCPRIFRVH